MILYCAREVQKESNGKDVFTQIFKYMEAENYQIDNLRFGGMNEEELKRLRHSTMGRVDANGGGNGIGVT